MWALSQYIEVGAPLEVNISETLRKQAALAITGHAEPHLHKVERGSEQTGAVPRLFSTNMISQRGKAADGVELVSHSKFLHRHASNETLTPCGLMIGDEKPKPPNPDDGGKSLLTRSSLGGFFQRLSAGGRHSETESHPAPLRTYDESVKTQSLTTPEELLNWFAPVVREVKQVILRDSWPRFRKSAFYAEVRAHTLGCHANSIDVV